MDEGKDIRGKINLDLLLVEGKDDEHVLYNLFVHYNIPQKFKIKKQKVLID